MGITDLFRGFGHKRSPSAIEQGAKEAIGASSTAATSGIGTPELAKLGAVFGADNPRAIAYMAAHGAETLPDIDETTRNELRTLLTQSKESHWSTSRTAIEIRKRFGFTASQAKTIAVTESATAYEQGHLALGRELQSAGLVMVKRWMADGDNPCDICQGNADEGWIPLDNSFSSGADAPTQHNGCNCYMIQQREGAGD